MDLSEIRITTKQLLRNGKPSFEQLKEALPYCKELYEAFPETNDLWDAHQYANCLKQLGNLDEAEFVCNEVYQLFADKDKTEEQEKPWLYIKKLYAWIIYEKYIKVLRSSEIQINVGIIIDKMLILAELICHGEQGGPSLSYCIIQSIKYALKSENSFDFEKALLLLEKLDCGKLSKEERCFTDQTGKERKLASEIEDYYQIKSEILLKYKRFDECVTCCSDAMESIPQFHYDNEVWFNRRIAKAFDGLGDIDNAIATLNKLTVVSDKWFLLSEIGNCYYRKKDYITALVYYLRAACTKDPEKMKVALFESIGDASTILEDQSFAQLNYLLAKTIRENNGWFIKTTLKRKIKEEKEVSFKEVRNQWIKKLYELVGEKKGTVSKLFPRNNGGFIQIDNNSYYFQSKNFLGKVELLKIGDKVCFIIVDSYDKKRQQSTKEAVAIIPQKNLSHNFR